MSRFSNKLHVAIFDPVMHHLDEVAGTTGSDVGHTWPIVDLGGNGFPNRADLLVGIAITAGHQAWAPQRSFLSARHSGTNKVNALCLQRFLSPFGIDEIGITAIDDDVTWSINGFICAMVQSTGSPALTSRIALRGRSSERTNSSGDLVGITCLPRYARRSYLPWRGHVENGNGKAISLDVHCEILAHYRETDHADLGGFGALFGVAIVFLG